MAYWKMEAGKRGWIADWKKMLMLDGSGNEMLEEAEL